MESSAPGITEILRHFSFDLFWILLILGSTALYLRGVQKLNAQHPRVPHPWWKTACFLTGMFILFISVMSPLEYYGNQMLSIDFLVFLLITMISPPLILLGSPLTLAFRVSSKENRRRLRIAYRSEVMRLLTFPVISGLLFASVTYLWQFSGLTDTAAHNHLVRNIQLFSLLFVSLVFWLPALCADPVRWRIGYPLRALYVFVEMTHKGLFAGMFLSMNRPVHTYIANHLPTYAQTPMDDQRNAILVLWLAGSVCFVLVIGGIVTRWVQYEMRATVRTDARLAKERAAEKSRRAALEKVFQKGV
jgi:putative copper resistance protein D